MPATVYGMEKYLGSGLIKGVGPKYAKKIVQRFGTDTFDVIENNVEFLIEIEGIGRKRIRMIAESWERQKEVKNIMVFLQDHQVSTSYAAKIYKQYGNGSIAVMKENPYQLADDIWGIGFKTADQIAVKLGFGKESYVRLRSGLMYTLSELSNEGHVFAEKQQLIEKASELLEASPETVVMTMDEMLKQEELILEKNIVRIDENGNQILPIYLPPFYFAEVGVAGKLKRLASSPAGDRLYTRLMEARKSTGNEALSVDVGAVQAKTGMEYDEIQADAIRRAATAKVMVLTGGPGTGKTTTTHGIISAYKAYGLRILLAAPTGRAAKRMTEATGFEARTIHRMLELNSALSDENTRKVSFERNEQNPLEADVIIIDEMSMVDIQLFQSLLKAVAPGTRLVLVGDVNQLPSVGPGQVLRDLICSGCFPMVELKKIFRQAEKSDIIVNAHRINNGQQIALDNKSRDFFLLERKDVNVIYKHMIQLIQDKLPSYVQATPFDIQVLTPMRKGSLGCETLNGILQCYLNPADDKKKEHISGNTIYREGDKVMQIKNNYQLEWEVVSKYGIPIDKGTGVFNGDMGKILEINESASRLVVEYDEQRRVAYPFSMLDELELSYAITIHKAQGSEYPAILLPLLGGPKMLFNRNLLYTAITRAKSCVTILGSSDTVRQMIDNISERRRYTALTERIKEIYKAGVGEGS